MTLAVKVMLVVIGSLGLSLILCVEMIHRLKRNALQQRVVRASVPGVSARRPEQGEGLDRRIERLAGQVLGLLVRTEIWPREISAVRILSHGVIGGLIIAIFLHLALKTSLWTSIPSGFLALVAIPIISAASEQKRCVARFEAMLSDTIDMMVRMLRAGLPVTVAVARLGREAAEPAGAIYREATEWLGMGMPLPQAMRMVAERISVRDFDFFAAALAIQSTVGGNLTETLESLARVIRERTVSVMKARAVTAQARTTANVILGIIPGLVVMLQLVRPGYLNPLVDGSHGYGLLVFVIVSYLVAFVTIRQLIKRVQIQ